MATVAAVLLVVIALRWLSRRSASMRARRRGARAVAGEHDAEQLLVDAGYDVLDRQVSLTWEIEVEGEAFEVALRADLLVSRGPLRYVAEVKTGDRAPSLTNPATRRQLLEYRVAYNVDGVLLVDAEAEEVLEVVFPLPGSPGTAPKRSEGRPGAALLSPNHDRPHPST